jgi:hypothetical protein
MKKEMLTLLVILTGVVPSYSQTAAELSGKYPAILSYEIRPGILITPKYAADGQVCQISFERRHVTRSGVYLGSSISERLATEIAGELAPAAARGKALSIGATLTTGVTEQQVSDYENVSINFSSLVSRPDHGIVTGLILWKNRSCAAEKKSIPLEQYPH